MYNSKSFSSFFNHLLIFFRVVLACRVGKTETICFYICMCVCVLFINPQNRIYIPSQVGGDPFVWYMGVVESNISDCRINLSSSNTQRKTEKGTGKKRYGSTLLPLALMSLDRLFLRDNDRIQRMSVGRVPIAIKDLLQLAL